MHGFLIQSALEHYAVVTPEHPALSLQGTEMSYRELDSRSNQLARMLLQQGVHTGDRVGIFMHKSLELGVAIYAVVKAGCVFVPLDPFMPVDRLALILGDCGIEHIVSCDALAPALSEIHHDRELRIYGIEEETPFRQVSWPEIGKLPVESPNTVLIDQDLGYIMYTSGSTGVPKGMMHTHLGCLTYARWGAKHVRMESQDRVASHAPLHFDLSIFDFFSTAIAGATVVLVPETVVKFPASWTKLIESERISVVFTVPYTLMTMLTQGALEKRNLKSLRWILFGGEPYPPQQLRALMLTLPETRFTNVYGPAEAPCCTCHDVQIPEEFSEEPVSIGTVSANSTDIIVDTEGNDCDVGVPGELCIRSTTLTRGYWKRPDLNAQVYLFRETHGPFPHVFFRTGDRVVREENGLLKFIGRIGRMVKTRGHRVELDEIEVILSSLDDVTEAASFTVPDGLGSVVVLAAVTLKDGATSDESSLLQFARSKLPPYAVPRRIYVLVSMPHTSTGKIDRRELIDSEQIREFSLT